MIQRSYLAACVSSLGSHLGGQRLGHLGSLLGLLQVVLGLPEPAEVDVELLLLQIEQWLSFRVARRPYRLAASSGFAHRFFRLPLVGLHLVLQLVHQVLQPAVGFLVFLGLTACVSRGWFQF